LLPVVIVLVAYSLALAWAFDHWSHRGVLVLNAAALVLLVGSGVVFFGEYGAGLTATRAFLCAGTTAVPPALIVMAANWIALGIAGGRSQPLYAKWILTAATCAAAAIPAMIVGLGWGIGVLGCDAL